MKRFFNLILIVGMLSFFSPAAPNPASGSPLSQSDPGVSPPAAQPESQEGTGMPGWPVPAQPVPHHEPGRLSRAGGATYQTTRLNDQGQEEPVELNGLDALLANGTLTDPLQGNYRLVNLDRVLFSSYLQANFSLQTYTVTPTLGLMPGSQISFGDFRSHDVAAGDLNGDQLDEQLATWINPGDNHIFLDLGEMAGVDSNKRTTSPPAAFLRSDGVLDLVVRGYDDTLWHRQYDLASSTWGDWSNQAGGFLLSGPTVVSRGADQLDVFAIGIDDDAPPNYLVVWSNHWENGLWSGWAKLDDPDESNPPQDWPTVTNLLERPLLPAPAVVARGGDRLDLFWRWSDNTLRWRQYNDSLWGGWDNLGGFLSTGPGAVALSSSQMVVFASGVDGALWQLSYTGNWGNWERVPGNGMTDGVAIASAPAVVSPSTGQLAVYLRGSDNQLWQIGYDGVNWGAWTPGGGLLASGLGVAVSPATNTTYLYAQDPEGSLGQGIASAGGVPVWQPGWNWLEFCCQSQPFDTTALGYFDASGYQEDYINNIDIETGYLFGDGREQIVLAYRSSAAEVALRLYDIQDGFIPKVVIPTETVRTGRFPKLTTGDFDKDGLDEIALFYFDHTQNKLRVEIFTLNTSTWILESTATAEFPLVDAAGLCPGWSLIEQDPERTFNIEAGDLNGDGDEELVVSWDAWATCQILSLNVGGYQARFSILEVENNLITPMSSEYYNHLGWDDLRCCSADTELALGDLNGDGVDEIVRTWPSGWDDNDWPDLYRSLQVIQASNMITPTKLAELAVIGWTRESWRDELAVGDLDRDLADEIVFFESDSYYDPVWDKLWFYQLQDGSLQVMGDPITFPFKVFSRIVTGDFTGESLRVGATYRLQNRVDSLEAVINMPPKHRDLVRLADGQYQRIDVLMEPCWDTPADPRCTHAKHGGKQGEISEIQTQFQRDWAIGGGLDAKVTKGGYFADLSLKYSYGANFSTSTNVIHERTFNQYATAYNHDRLVYYGAPYQVWEYPILGDNTGEPLDYITVAFPLPDETGSTPTPNTVSGDFPDEPWYAPRHQTYNVWSYDPVGTVRFPDYDPAGFILDKTISGGGDWFEVDYSQTTAIITSTTQSHDFNAEVGAGYKGEAHIPFTSIKFGLKFRAYVKGSYAQKDIQTDKLTTSKETMLSAGIAEQDTEESFTIRPIAYWANAGYLVLDYQTDMGDWGVWQQYYNRPDPAFILPWYGFPDPNDPIPPTSPELKLYSYDVQVSPPYAGAGDKVTISATVRNFSNHLAGNVKVRFYQGYPAEDNQIGEATIASLYRPNGPQTVSITWIASGVGEQKIYAVIDPLDAIDEVHDTGDLIDNNIAYARFRIGAATYGDMGLAQEQVYQSQTYTQTNEPVVSAYIPPANLEEITLFELKDANLAVAAVMGNPFMLTANPGSLDWNTEQDYSLKPDTGAPPAVITIQYKEADVAGFSEANLTLYRLEGIDWIEATCPGYEIVRFLEDNRLAMPICQTGTFVLSDHLPQWNGVYLPLISR
ncbi:MAG: CARDB domain-containing protein [Anaerolineales bacterium]